MTVFLGLCVFAFMFFTFIWSKSSALDIAIKMFCGGMTLASVFYLAKSLGVVVVM